MELALLAAIAKANSSQATENGYAFLTVGSDRVRVHHSRVTGVTSYYRNHVPMRGEFVDQLHDTLAA